jgi:hypothetical protein
MPTTNSATHLLSVGVASIVLQFIIAPLQCSSNVARQSTANTKFSGPDTRDGLRWPTQARSTRDARLSNVKDAFDGLPLSFELNCGQADSSVTFLSRLGRHRLFLSPIEAVLSMMTKDPQRASDASTQGSRKTHTTTGFAELRMRLVGGNPAATAMGDEQLPGSTNYFLGRDPKAWRTNIPNYAKVIFNDVYDGIDLVYYGNQRELEYDFVISPGTDTGVITMAFDGVDKLSVNKQDELVLETPAGVIKQAEPVVYQQDGALRRRIPASYRITGKNQIGFEIAAYDRHKPLIIDPVLAYSTYLGGGSFDRGNAVAVDSAGNAFVAGSTRSTNFPVTPGAFQTANAGFGDAFVAKLNPAGTAVIYSTYFGGGGIDTANAIAIDATGNAYVTGNTDSSNLPTTPGAFRTTIVGTDESDAFSMKLNSTGTALMYSTYLGPVGGIGIAVDSSGNAYITGQANGDYPTTAGAFQTVFGGNSDAFITKLNATGSALIYSSFLGGNGFDFAVEVAIDLAGNAYVVGGADQNFPVTAGAFQTGFNGIQDAFVAKVNPSGTSLVYSTYLGGAGNEVGAGISLDVAGNAYLTGSSNSVNYPVTAGAFQANNAGNNDAIVTKLNSTGASLIYSTYLGGSGNDFATGIGLDTSGNTWITGQTASANFPVSADAIQPALAGMSDVFATELNPAGTGLSFSTFLGGSNTESAFALALNGNDVYITGETFSSNFPTTSGSFQASFGGGPSDGFVSKLSRNNFDVCFKDDGDGNFFQFNSTTGEYRFTMCSSAGETVSGRGTVARRGCLIVVEDRLSEQRVQARINTCTQNASAVIQLGSRRKTTFVITDKDISNSNCGCP